MMPVMTMPAVVPIMAVVPVTVMPVHLHRLDVIDFVLRHKRRLNICQCRDGRRVDRERRDGSSLCTCGKHNRTRDQSSTEIQEIPKFHGRHALFKVNRETGRTVSPPQDERSLNSLADETAGHAKWFTQWR